MNDDWISTDNPPPFYRRVLTCDENKFIRIGEYINNSSLGKIDCWIDPGQRIEIKPTFWRHLPKTPFEREKYLRKTSDKKINNQQFDYLIPEISKKMLNNYFSILKENPDFNSNEIDTSPLLNLTMSIFLTCFLQVLDIIKEYTEGEEKLINNINLTRKGLTDFFKNLPFTYKVEEVLTK